jgi:hypothetical protein
MTAHDLADGEVLGRGPPRLVDGGTIVVTGRLWPIGRIVRTGGEAEACSSVNHVQVEGSPQIEHPLQGIGQSLKGSYRAAAAPPDIVPTRIKLAAKQGPSGLDPTNLCEVLIRIAGETHPTDEPGHLGRLQRPGHLRGVQRHVKSRFPQGGCEGLNVAVIPAMAIVLILHLHHGDRSTAGHLKRCKLFPQGPVVAANSTQVPGVPTAHAHVPILQQPPRQASKIILAADIGPGPDEHLQPFPLGLPTELGDVVLPRPVELPGFRLVLAPEDIGADGVQSERLGHLQAMLPVLAGDAGGVEFAAVNRRIGSSDCRQRQRKHRQQTDPR